MKCKFGVVLRFIAKEQQVTGAIGNECLCIPVGSQWQPTSQSVFPVTGQYTGRKGMTWRSSSEFSHGRPIGTGNTLTIASLCVSLFGAKKCQRARKRIRITPRTGFARGASSNFERKLCDGYSKSGLRDDDSKSAPTFLELPKVRIGDL
jgi:hypothetical protein